MIPKFPKQIYEYLGDPNAAFAARMTSRCPSCAPLDTGTTPQEIGTPVSPLCLAGIPLDMEVVTLTETSYVILYVSTTQVLYAVACTVPVGGTAVTFGSATILDSTKKWRYIGADRLSDTEFIVAGTQSGPTAYTNLYALSASVDENRAITPGSVNLLSSAAASGIYPGAYLRSIQGTANQFLLSFVTSPAVGERYASHAVVTHTDSSNITMGPYATQITYDGFGRPLSTLVRPLTEHSTDPSIQYGFNASGISQGRMYPISISGITVAVGEDASLGSVESGIPASAMKALTHLGSNAYIFATGTTLADPKIVAYYPQTDSDYTYQYADGHATRGYDITAGTSGRFALINTRQWGGYAVTLDLFSFLLGSFTLYSHTVVQTFECFSPFVTLGKDGLTSTKFPAVYIEGCTNCIKTFVFEMGTP
jgi:hypothetical protein